MKDADSKKLVKQANLEHDKAMKLFKAEHAKVMEANPGGKGPKQPKKSTVSTSVNAPFSRYDDWSQAQLAVEEIERKEALLDATKRMKQSQGGALGVQGGGANTLDPEKLTNTSEKGVEDMEEEDDEDEEEEDDVEEDADDDVEEEEDVVQVDNEQTEMDMEEDVTEVLEEDIIVHVEAKEKSAEDDEFEQMLAKTMKVHSHSYLFSYNLFTVTM